MCKKMKEKKIKAKCLYCAIQNQPLWQVEYATMQYVRSERGQPVNWRGDTHASTHRFTSQKHFTAFLIVWIWSSKSDLSVHNTCTCMNTHTGAHTSACVAESARSVKRTYHVSTTHQKLKQGKEKEKKKKRGMIGDGISSQTNHWQSGHTLSGQLGATGQDLKVNGGLSWWFVVSVWACISVLEGPLHVCCCVPGNVLLRKVRKLENCALTQQKQASKLDRHKF